MQLTNTLIDNSENLKLVDTINQIIAEHEINEICIATGYWDLKGTALITENLLQFLEKQNTKLRLLIGKDPNVFKSDLTTEAYKNAKKYPADYFKIDLQNIELNNEQYQKAAKMLLDYCSGENPKIEVKIFETNENDEKQFLHSKCYIFVSNKNSYGIIGSSNFTQKGLAGNAELNYLETDGSRIMAEPKIGSATKGHYCWFYEKWELAKPWNEEFEIMLSSSPIGKAAAQQKKDESTKIELTPYETYIKLLQDKFEIITDSTFRAILTGYLPEGIKPLEYQLDAVQQCYSNMLSHGGFALGDVVGLGKTIVGVLIAKYFIDVASSLEKSDKILIIAPPAIKQSWLDTIKKFDSNQSDKIADYVDILTTGSLNHLVSEELSEDDDIDDDCELEIQSAKDYGLILIDESHKFRNSNTQMYIAFTEYLESVNKRAGYYPYIGLLSATMQNNAPRDIQNQIYLFEHESKKSSFEKVEGRDLDHFFAIVNSRFELLKHSNNKQGLIELSKEVREKVLSDILVRRTRTDITKYFSKDAANLKFPNVHEPDRLLYQMDKKLSQLFSDTMDIIAPVSETSKNGLGYYRYRGTMFLNSKYDKVYSGRNMTAQRSSSQLARMMQILLVKRLESSMQAFKESLCNLRRYTQNMITMWEQDCIFICPQIDVNKELNIKEKQERNPNKTITIEDCFDDIRSKIAKLDKEGKNSKKQNAEYCRENFKELGEKSYVDYLKEDLAKIDELVERWNENDFDPKFERFKDSLKESMGLFNKERNIPHKLVIFSEALRTVESLSRAVENITGKEPLVITAKNRDKMQDVIKANFDANCEKEKQKNDYDVIITTEVLAEGINLHRANSILNYDTPWNATKLIQRIGRVNRIGSENKDIYVYNFYPSEQGDEQIKLVQNAYTKLQAFHTMFGEDSKIFSEDEELFEGNFEAMVNGIESPQEKYIAKLKEYREHNKERYEFIEKLEKAEIKTVKTAQNGNSYFAIKVENNHGCVYVKVGSDLQGKVVSYLEMFEECNVEKGAESLEKPKDYDLLCNAAMNAYNVYESTLNKAKNVKANISNVIERANNWIRSKSLDKEAMSLIGAALKSVKAGNTTLAKRLKNLLDDLEKPSLIELTSEDIVNMIKTELGNIASENAKKRGEAYIFGGFMFYNA